MLRTNEQNLVEQSVLGSIAHPRLSLRNPYLIDSSGHARVVPGSGGISYNVIVGDSAVDFIGDHVEPGVSVAFDEREKNESPRGALSILTCIGNEAIVVSGPAAGSNGVVTGKHGGVEHVLIDFAPSVLEKLAIGTRIQIRSFGQGLRLRDFSDIHVMNVDPRLLRKMGVAQQNKQLFVPVTHVIPASIMGSGIGSRHSFSGDYDIQITDIGIVQKYGLQNLRLGDVIAIRDADCRFGRSLSTGAVSIGIIVHTSCITSGHGPGVTVIMSTVAKLVVPKIEKDANITHYLEIGRQRRRARSRRRRR